MSSVKTYYQQLQDRLNESISKIPDDQFRQSKVNDVISDYLRNIEQNFYLNYLEKRNEVELQNKSQEEKLEPYGFNNHKKINESINNLSKLNVGDSLNSLTKDFG
jgi:hypothetical protein